MSQGLPVIVHFAEGIPGDAQGVALLAFEQHLRQLTGLDVRVVCDKMDDDSKLRRLMTPEERERL